MNEFEDFMKNNEEQLTKSKRAEANPQTQKIHRRKPTTRRTQSKEVTGVDERIWPGGTKNERLK